MRVFIKNQILEIIPTICEGINYAKTAPENEKAIVLGDCIEAVASIAASLQAGLSESCFNSCYESVIESIANGLEALMNLKDDDNICINNLMEISALLQKEQEVKLEIVFLPYKASMWDSMESVWQIANNDARCDAYVIPIPYYDKDKNGNFLKEYYEADQYPSYVPLVNYKEYNFEKRQPDIVIIHNPYDDCNYVTSVDPFFYSSNLKKYTNKLVYIPYFVLDEISSDDNEAIERVKHFFAVPAVVNANTVIVQSEEMKKAYVKILTKLAGENTRTHWENKIVGLGSPKFDKVLTTTLTDIELPDEWLEKINKKDGTKKKVFLYNTSIASLLKNDLKTIEKIKQVFEVFKENQDRAVLLWRPHPLIESTIKSMRPRLYDEYMNLVKNFREENYGIFDDSPDINRAVALSDAYYGDLSSVVHLYKITGKPIMIQEIN